MRYAKLLLLTIVMGFYSCGKMGSSTPAESARILLPGECLSSPELSYYTPNSEGQQVNGNCFLFGFTMDLTCHKKERIDNKEIALSWRDVPSDELFSSFGINQAVVKSEYERVFEDFSKSYESRFHQSFYSIVTILYNGGVSLVANKEFAGYPAGENLAPLITNNPIYDNIVLESGENPIIAPGFNTPSNAGGFLGIPLDYICMLKDGVEFSIPIDNHQLVEESVTFNLEIPVKVVLYLTWLNDKRTNPNASVPYKEEVLHCTFTTKFGLK